MLQSGWTHFISNRILVQLLAVSVQLFALPKWALLIRWSHSYRRWHRCC